MGVVEIEATQERREGKIWDFGVWAVKEMGMERLLFLTGLVFHRETNALRQGVYARYW